MSVESKTSSFCEEAEKKIKIPADRHEDERELADTRSCPNARKEETFISGTGAEDFVPKWEHFTCLHFLDDTINPVESASNLDYMELEINATVLNVSVSTEVEDLFETIVEPLPIPCSGSQISQLPQGTRVSTSTPQAKKRKVNSNHEEFYDSMQKCLGAVDKKTIIETFAAFIASELDNLPCPKQQAAIHAKDGHFFLDYLQE
ncbi:hypothetical protein TNIN_4491 [Trichonephila inaurata madagascariensis]|uniref:Uncharacterized protein n=1 Tax=Trichonephila inaurata madagascariensis TaxID=2747483 RepID=A0A8X6XUL4_9ARAC|nr:hypothetical protein TNIN_4491 [Trichonephila inaurata madagascariensis]